MFKRISALENENRQLQQKVKSHRLIFFILGMLFGGCIVLNKERVVSSNLHKLLHGIIFKETDEDVDQETLEVLEEEKDNFE